MGVQGAELTPDAHWINKHLPSPLELTNADKLEVGPPSGSAPIRGATSAAVARSLDRPGCANLPLGSETPTDPTNRERPAMKTGAWLARSRRCLSTRRSRTYVSSRLRCQGWCATGCLGGTPHPSVHPIPSRYEMLCHKPGRNGPCWIDTCGVRTHDWFVLAVAIAGWS